MKKIKILGLFLITAALVCGCSGKERRELRQTGIEAMEAGDLERAVAAFDQVIEASEDTLGRLEMDVLKYRAESEYLLGDYKAASDTYGILIERDKERPEYFAMRCIARCEAGDWEGTVEDYRRLEEIDPKGETPAAFQALLAAGEALENQGNTGEAMELYLQAESRGKKSADLYNHMGICRLKEEDYADAQSYFDKGLWSEDAASVPELLFNKAVACEYQGDFAKALELMNQYVEAGGEDQEALREIEFLKTR